MQATPRDQDNAKGGSSDDRDEPHLYLVDSDPEIRAARWTYGFRPADDEDDGEPAA